MDINNIALIIITAFINLVISNFVFLRYQKKIETSFTKSMLEYQTKFVRNHEKMAETLETIYKRFHKIVTEANSLYKTIPYTSEKNAEPSIIENRIDKLVDEYEVFAQYFTSNKIYLSEDTSSFIGTVVWKVRLIFSMLPVFEVINDNKTPEDVIKVSIEFMNSILTITGLKLTEFTFEELNTKISIEEITEALSAYLKNIEKHYREVSGVN